MPVCAGTWLNTNIRSSPGAGPIRFIRNDSSFVSSHFCYYFSCHFVKFWKIEIAIFWPVMERYQVNSGPSEFGTKWTRDQVVNSGPNIFGTRWIRDQTLGEFGTNFFLSYKYVNTGISYLVWVPFPTYFIAPLWYASLCWICVCFIYFFPW